MNSAQPKILKFRPLPAALMLVVALLFWSLAIVASAATITFLDGKTLECKVVTKDDESVTVELSTDGVTEKRVLPLSDIHTVTINGKRHVINEKPAGEPLNGKVAAKAPAKKAADGKEIRTRAEVDALINELGRKPPDWYEATPLNYPKTLDLTWPAKPPAGWNNQQNVGQYIWDVINPNQNKWREGVRLLHHLLSVNKDSPETLKRIMNSLGIMYFNLHEDHARAAFWWRQAGVEKEKTFANSTVNLAECYLQLGNKQMALEQLKKAAPTINTIKLYAELGDLPTALKVADQYASGGVPELAYLTAGDACRSAGRLPQTISYYQKVLDLKAEGNAKGRVEKSQRRAQDNLSAVKLFDLSDPAKTPDGTYEAESLGYEAQVRVEVVVKAKRIESVKVVQHREKQYYSSLTDTPAKIIAKQGVKGVDATTGATLTSEAIINATAKALSTAAK